MILLHKDVVIPTCKKFLQMCWGIKNILGSGFFYLAVLLLVVVLSIMFPLLLLLSLDAC